jgi:hypothetical protein
MHTSLVRVPPSEAVFFISGREWQQELRLKMKINRDLLGAIFPQHVRNSVKV